MHIKKKMTEGSMPHNLQDDMRYSVPQKWTNEK